MGQITSIMTFFQSSYCKVLFASPCHGGVVRLFMPMMTSQHSTSAIGIGKQALQDKITIQIFKEEMSSPASSLFEIPPSSIFRLSPLTSHLCILSLSLQLPILSVGLSPSFLLFRCRPSLHQRSIFNLPPTS